MKRLTVHITNAERKQETWIDKNGKKQSKMKTFNTLSFIVADDEAAKEKLSDLIHNDVNVTKSNCIFIH
jgi:hypothetical protein